MSVTGAFDMHVGMFALGVVGNALAWSGKRKVCEDLGLFERRSLIILASASKSGQKDHVHVLPRRYCARIIDD